ncbi:SAM-dependent methyltransferase [Alteromonas halophila]|uniref:SAM-dependent methyltransferase n=1 Tax=Alteromonas halophila TaxID=516698 RepID=A0A918JPQ1_9ALTE|nr:SAM-dependent methyltransferase [Alteromonas halophila]
MSWSQFDEGERIRLAIEGVCNDFAPRIFGYHFLRLGELSSEVALPGSPIRHIFNQTQQPHEHSSVVSQSHCLPYSENSIDGVLLANELDFAQDPHQVLREVDRVITQNGYVIISGFNPFSVTGLVSWLPVKRKKVLYEARFFTAGRIKDWLQLLGFEIIEQQHVLFSMLQFKPPMEASRMQNLMQRYLPRSGSVYVILARKRVIPMSTIRPRMKLKPQFSPLGASMRVQAEGRTKK